MSDGDRSDVQQRLAQLDDNVRKASLRGAWQREGRAQEPGVSPWVWPWKDILPSITEAGEIVPIDDVMRMRTIALVNPSQVLPFGTTRTFGVTIQHLNPGETTESHRHTPASIYFTIQGGGVYTTAEGEQQFMEPGDLLVQPSWTWHGSQNTGEDAGPLVDRDGHQSCRLYGRLVPREISRREGTTLHESGRLPSQANGRLAPQRGSGR